MRKERIMRVKKGDRVKVHYTLKCDDGEVVETTRGAVPIEFTVGKGEVIRGFEDGVIGMKVGESKVINIPVDQAYGERDERKVFELSRERTPDAFRPQIGQLVRLFRPDGRSFIATVIDITEKGFKMDANHPLAGKNLIFEVELIKILSS
jgi:peptidylprolyl isomerase